jgi:hypothetical protein
MNPFVVLLLAYAGFVIFYVSYIAAIETYYAWDSLDVQAQLTLFPFMVGFIIWDSLWQYTICTALFWDWPAKHEFMVTMRLSRYRKGPEGWRKRVADGICEKFLNPFDIKGHC